MSAYICGRSPSLSVRGRPPTRPRYRTTQPHHGALPAQVLLELSQRGKDIELEFARAGGRVDVFLEALKSHVLLPQPLDFDDEILEGPAEAVEPPDAAGYASK